MSLPEAPAPAAPALSGEVSQAADALCAAIDRVLAEGGIESLPMEVIQQVLALGVKLYAARRAAGTDFPPVPGPGSVNGTEVAVVTTALLQAANLDLFELSLWRQWGRA